MGNKEHEHLSQDETELDVLYAKRSDMVAEVTRLIKGQQYEKALEEMPHLVAMDEQLEGSISNTNLLRYADIYAALRCWHKATDSLLQLCKQIEAQISEIETRDELDPMATQAASITHNSLHQLLAIIPGRLRMYQDLRERIGALRGLVRDKLKLNENGEVRGVIRELRYKFALNSLPTAFRPILELFIEKLCDTKNISDEESYRKADIVFSYLADYFGKIDPENDRNFVDICMEMPDDPEFEDSRAARTYNQLAAEERIRNRAQRVLVGNKNFIESNMENFGKLERIVDAFVELSDKIALDRLPDALVEFVRQEGIVLE